MHLQYDIKFKSFVVFLILNILIKLIQFDVRYQKKFHDQMSAQASYIQEMIEIIFSLKEYEPTFFIETVIDAIIND